MIEKWFVYIWQKKTIALLPMLPLSWLYGFISRCRRGLYRLGLLKTYRAPVPVIVIGNITAGGTGKTPLTLALIDALQARGFHPGVVSRGYKGKITATCEVTSQSTPAICGDEPVLMRGRTNVPIFVHPRRALAVEALCRAYPACDVILCDDGLQHYSLQRDIELVVIDTVRGFGNGLLLPAGPLRENIARLTQVDHVILNGSDPFPLPQVTAVSRMQLKPAPFYQLVAPQHQRDADAFMAQQCHAIAGIGHPARFFTTLAELGIVCAHTAFPDHYAFRATDLPSSEIIFVTEKDAVKLAALKDDRIWVLPVNAVIAPELANFIVSRLEAPRAHG